MKSLNALYGTLLWYFLCLASLALVVGALSALIRVTREKRGGRARLLALAEQLLAFLLFAILMDAGHAAVNHTGRYLPLERALFALPWLVYALAELCCLLLLFQIEFDHRRYRKTHLTSDVIRQTVDLLPEGIAVSDGGGTVRLSNLKMEELCRELTGETLYDAGRFVARLEERGEHQNGQLLVRTPRGRVWLFEEEPLILEEESFDQLTARDVTERYRIMEELRDKNAHLRDLQRRMRAVSELSGDMFIAEEQQRARASLHNQLGQVLLMGRHYIDHPESADPRLVYTAARQMNRFLLGESEEPAVAETDPLTEAVAAAGSIGVRVELKGDAPRKAQIRELIAQAVAECAANTVKHAEGDALSVEFTDNGKGVLVSVTNNGRPPKAEIAESGGLLTLRRRVEDAGGVMRVESEPAFVLTLALPLSPEGGDPATEKMVRMGDTQDPPRRI